MEGLANERLDFGKMGYGYKHYRRRCKIRAPCCNEIFECRHCHNEAVGMLKNPYDRHEINRLEVTQYLFDSLKDTTVMKCGHTMHYECYDEMIEHDNCRICSKSIIDMSRTGKRIGEEDSLAEEAKAKLEEMEPDREAWKKLCTSFLKGRL
ncbi:hypothetical protein LWI29_036493 [Acer saccharum]|uniref:CHY-type domain-containing protein n=1 Tax=Acer saccharum TaxID=4024 RepID=A0AA39WBR2_ACESA|nr:hypothetical protein LWI29_036493 [Acer saccharum]